MLGAAPALAYTPHVLRYADNLDVSSLNTFLATPNSPASMPRATPSPNS
jgi:hypothetical protein